MKKSILIAISFSICHYYLHAQEEVQLKDLKTPVAPAFSLLDFAPKIIESPGTIKALSTNLLFNAAVAGGIPKNFAFEISPYWFMKHPHMSIFKYYGLKEIDEGKDEFGQDKRRFENKRNIFYGLRSTSVSLGSVFKDSSKMHPINANYIGYAIRSNIINIRDKRINARLAESIINVNGALENVLSQAIGQCVGVFDSTRVDCIGKFIAKSNDSILKNARNMFATLVDVRPVFSVDLAVASSTIFANNSFSNSQAYRSGGWLTLAYQKPLVTKKNVNKDINNLINSKNYLNVLALIRRMNGKHTADFKMFKTQKILDFGGRLELEVNRFSISVESVRRTIKAEKVLNSSRTVGIFQFRVNDKLYLLGTFGKDFGNINNLVSLLGLNWGFGESALNKISQ